MYQLKFWKQLWKYLKLIIANVLTFDIGHCPDVVFRRQYKFIVNNPVGFVIKTATGVKLNDLIIFNRQIVAGSFKMRDLK